MTEQNQELRLENEVLKLKVTQLENIIIQLKDKLNINSTNSSLPTSQEIYRIEKKSRPKSDRNPGVSNGSKMIRALGMQRQNLLPGDDS